MTDKDQQPANPRSRLQVLRAIPERQRTDEEWDELHQLEIMLAPGNRQDAPLQPGQRPPQQHRPRQEGHQRQDGHSRPGGDRGPKPPKKFRGKR